LTKSLAAVLLNPAGPLTVKETIVRDPGPGEVKVQITATGYCHTDLIPRGYGEGTVPIILGHEGSGVVAEVGAGVTDIAVGDHVVLTFGYCGQCNNCQRGLQAYCDNFEALNLHFASATPAATDIDGNAINSRWFRQSSFSQYVIADERNTIKIPEDVPLDIMGPLGCGVQTGAGAVLNEMTPSPDKTLVIFGAGAVGLSALMAAVAGGMGDVVVVDRVETRLELAKELGAARVVRVDGDDFEGVGSGFDYALDTTGAEAVMPAAIRALRRPGICILLGAGMSSLTIGPFELAGKHVTYCYEGSAVPKVFIPQLVELWRRGKFPFERLIKRYDLADIAQAEADSASGITIKPLIVMPSPASN
jgi:aryl-alcohol dehydrogenase